MSDGRLIRRGPGHLQAYLPSRLVRCSCGYGPVTPQEFDRHQTAMTRAAPNETHREVEPR